MGISLFHKWCLRLASLETYIKILIQPVGVHWGGLLNSTCRGLWGQGLGKGRSWPAIQLPQRPQPISPKALDQGAHHRDILRGVKGVDHPSHFYTAHSLEADYAWAWPPPHSRQLLSAQSRSQRRSQLWTVSSQHSRLLREWMPHHCRGIHAESSSQFTPPSTVKKNDWIKKWNNLFHFINGTLPSKISP